MSVILSLLIATSAPAVTAADVADDAVKENKDEKICKRFPPPVGTRLRGRKICATRQQWAEQEQQRDTAMDNLQNRTGWEEQ